MSDTQATPAETETLYWPVCPVGFAGPAETRPEGWLEKLQRHNGVRAGDVVEFITERVVERFRLTVFESGAYEAGPAAERNRTDVLYVSEAGHAADSLAALIAHIHADGQRDPWSFPHVHDCRIIDDRRLVPLRLRIAEDQLRFEVFA